MENPMFEITSDDFDIDGIENREVNTALTDSDFEQDSLSDSDFETVEKTEDDWLTDTSFIQDAKTLADFMPVVDKTLGSKEFMVEQQGTDTMFKPAVGIDELQAGIEAATEAYQHSDEQYAEGAMQAIGQLQWNLKDLGLTAMNVGDWPEDAQMALIRSMKRYDDMPVEMRHVGRAATGIISDPTTYLGFGIFAKALGKVGLKGGATALLKSMVSKTVGTAALTAGVEGGAYMAADDVFRQGIDNQGDYSKTDVTQVGSSAAIGFTAALGIGWIAGKFVTRKMVKEADEVTDEVTDEVPQLTDDTVDVATELNTDVPEELDLQAERIGWEGGKANDDDLLGDEIPTGGESKPIEGDLLDVEPNTGVVAREADEEPRLDGETDSYNNAEELNKPENDVGEDWNHLYNGKKTFNTERLETSDNVKGFLESASAQTAKRRLGPPETLDESMHFAQEEAARIKEETGGDISALIEEFKDDAAELQKIRHRSQALRELNLSLGERVFALAEKQLDELSFAESIELVEKAALFANTMEMTKLISREFARGLGNYRLIMSGDSKLADGLVNGTAQADVAALSATIRAMSLAGNLKNGKFANGKTDLKGLRERLSPKFVKGALQEWIRFRSAMMLSGPSTIEAAAISNLSRLYTEPFWEWAGNIGRGTVKAQARLRAKAQWAGNRRFAKDAWSQAARAWKNGQHISDPMVTKVEGQQDESLQAMSALRRNVWERGVHAAHLALLFLDEGVKANRSRSLIYADTVVEAAKAGIKDDTKFEEMLTQNLLAKIDGNGRIRDKEILREVREATFTSDLEGVIGETITKLANAGGGMGRLFVVPFIRAPLNIVSEGLMYIPLSGYISRKQKNIMQKGSPVAKAKLKARKQLGGAAIIGLWYAADSEMYTGAGPADYKMRESMKAKGWQPHSIRVGDRWVSYAKLGPFSLLLGIVADVNYITKMDTSDTNIADATTQTLGMLVHVVANNVLNKAYFQSLTQLMEAIQNPDVSANVIHSWVLSHTPNILSQMNEDRNVREATSLMEKFERRIPIMSEKLGKQYDIYGRPVMKPNHDVSIFGLEVNYGVGYMFKNVEIVKDDVADEIYKLSESFDRAIIDKPPYTLGITNTDYRDVYDNNETESVYAKYNRVLGETIDPNNGLDMHDALERMMNSTSYRNAPHSAEGDITSPKVKMIKSIVNRYRGMAKNVMYRDSPAFKEQIEARGNRIKSIFN